MRFATETELRDYGVDVLQMDYDRETQLQWLAYSGLKARMPSGWGAWCAAGWLRRENLKCP